MNKLVSIVLPTFNGSAFIQESIESIINQSYSQWELIIVNDCSTDNTLEIIEEYTKKDSRIKIINNETNQKLPKSLNIGFEIAKGEYFTWTSDDNIYKKDALKFMVEYLNKNPKTDLISCDFDFIKEDGTFENTFSNLVPGRTPLGLAKQCNIGACFLYRKSLAQEVGNYDTEMFCAEDYDYWCRAALHGTISYSDENLYKYRNHSNSLTATKQQIILEKTQQIQRKYKKELIQKYREHYTKIFLKDFVLSEIKKFIYNKEKHGNRQILRFFGIKISIVKDQYEKLNNNIFFDYKIRPNSILIVEPNPYHAEILPGFVKYFQDLNYNVDLFLRHENIIDSPFTENTNINIFGGSAKHLKQMLKQKKIENYEFIFLSSSAFWEKNLHHDSYLNYLKFNPKSKHGLLIVEHNIEPCIEQYNEKIYVEEKRLFTLSGFNDTQILNPHYFGKTTITPKSQDKTRFIVVGGINKACKNHDLLLKSAEALAAKDYKFEIIIIGSGDELKIPKKLTNYITIKGRLTFTEMYAEMEKADFFLPLLDPEIVEHNRYKSTTTSGSRQLILGFLKPCLINEEFAKVYAFEEKNSIVYEHNKLEIAMKKAIGMSQEDYTKIQNNLKMLADEIYKKSLLNLELAIERIKN